MLVTEDLVLASDASPRAHHRQPRHGRRSGASQPDVRPLKRLGFGGPAASAAEGKGAPHERLREQASRVVRAIPGGKFAWSRP